MHGGPDRVRGEGHGDTLRSGVPGGGLSPRRAAAGARGPTARPTPAAGPRARPRPSPGPRPPARSRSSASISTAAGGVPRVCRVPWRHCAAAYGGTRTSTAPPGARATSSASRCLVSSRRSAASAAPPRNRSRAGPTRAGSAGWRRTGTTPLSAPAAAQAPAAAPACPSRAIPANPCYVWGFCDYSDGCFSDEHRSHHAPPRPGPRDAVSCCRPSPALRPSRYRPGHAGRGLVLAPGPAAATGSPPASFTGYGFDQCTAPSQRAMDAWLTGSPYWAVGIYISGDSRGCREPAEPDARLGQHPARATAGGCCRSRSARRPRAPPASATCTRSGSAPAADRHLRGGPPPGPGRGRARRSPPRRRSASPPAARSGTTWRRSRPRTTDCRESALSFLSAWTEQLHDLRLRLGRLLQRRVRHQDARRRPRHPAGRAT